MTRPDATSIDGTGALRSVALQPSERLWSVESLAMVAFLCLMTVVGVGSVSSVLLAIVGFVSLLGAVLAKPWRPADVSARRVTLGLVALAGAALAVAVHTAHSLSRAFDGFGAQFAAPVLAAAVATGVVAYVVYRTQVTTGVRWLATVLLLGVLVVTGVAYVVGVVDTSIDVFTLHQDAAAALAGGENPYVVVEGPDFTRPLALGEGERIIGYPYPPFTLYAYSLAQWLTGDPRWTSVAAAAAAVLLVAAPWLSVPRPQASVRLGAALLLASAPAFGVVTYFAWIEPLALPFLVVAGRFWRSRPVVSAIALGLALATKQYFLLALPLLVLWPDEFRWRRVAIVAGTVLATALPFLIWDPRALWEAAVGLHLETLPRPASINLVHLGIEVPRWLAVGVPIGLGLWLGRRGGEGFRFMLALATVLAALFLLGVQAFQNYWYLVASMALVGLVDRYNPTGMAELAATPAASAGDQPPN